jgi:hypothetical protein
LIIKIRPCLWFNVTSLVYVLGPIEDELLRADPRYSMAAQLRAESFDLWVGAGGLTGSWYGRSLSEAIEAARWLEDPEGNAAELARAREMGAIR